MKESIHKYFQIGVIQWMSNPKRNVLESIHNFASDDFFDVLEVCKFTDDETRQAAKKLLDQSHLKVCYGAQPTLLEPKLNPNALAEEERLKAELALIKALDEAVYLNASSIAFLAGKWEKNRKEEGYAQLLKTTAAICDYAASKGMFVELEVFDYDMDKAALIGPAPLAFQFAADMRKTSQNFGLIVDLSHFPTTYETSKFVVQTLRPYITHFHIGNAVVIGGCEAYGDQHPRFGFPNSANNVPELLDFFRVLKVEGFFVAEKPFVLSFEVKPWKDEDEDIVLANTKRVINRAWALLED
ncbi:MAG: TIM barrel protein [Flexilinea sp.]